MKEAVEILMVEDNPSDIDLARIAFRRAQIKNRLHVVHTAEQALRFLEKRTPHEQAPRPDIVFLDLSLPGTPGTKVLESMKENPELSAIPIIVLTGSDAPSDIDDAYRLHASCFLTKPVDLALMLEAVASLDGFFVMIGRAEGDDGSN